jgi:hypothetical protein
MESAGSVLARWRRARIAFSGGVDRGLNDHQLVHGIGHLLVRHLGAMEIVHCVILLSTRSQRLRNKGAASKS